MDDEGRLRTIVDACEILSCDGHIHASKLKEKTLEKKFWKKKYFLEKRNFKAKN
jgi:hypothetical protein